MTDFEKKFKEEFPRKKKFYSSLTGSDKEYEHLLILSVKDFYSYIKTCI